MPAQRGDQLALEEVEPTRAEMIQDLLEIPYLPRLWKPQGVESFEEDPLCMR